MTLGQLKECEVAIVVSGRDSWTIHRLDLVDPDAFPCELELRSAGGAVVWLGPGWDVPGWVPGSVAAKVAEIRGAA